MRLLCTLPEMALFVICALGAISNAIDWSIYSTCAAPIQIFLVLAPLTLMSMILTFSFFRAYLRISRVRKYIDALMILFLTPFCLYLIIQGVIWQFIIYLQPVNSLLYCPARSSPTYWIWIMLLSVIEIRFVRVSWIMGKAYWRAYQIRRTIRDLQQSADNGDYERFNEIVLELGEVENNRIGLLQGDIERLEKKYYQPAEQQAGDNVENCPICLVEFHADEKVVTLPKCEHTFHSECVGAWLQKKPLCPMCRRNVRNGLVDLESQNEGNQSRPYPPEVGENA